MMKTLPGKRYEPETTALERQALCRLLKTAAISGPHLEIGTAAGATLAEMISSYSEPDRPKFVVVDTFEYFENQLEAVKENLAKVGADPETVEFRKGYSDELFRLASANGDSFGFIFIDGNHKNGFCDPRSTLDPPASGGRMAMSSRLQSRSPGRYARR